MSTLSQKLPDSLHDGVRNLAKQDNISINQLVATALTEKVSALSTTSYLQDSDKRNHKAEFDIVFAKIKANEPDEQDKL